MQEIDKPLVIGWKEYIDFPDWGLRRVKAKIDTGARTSALDVLSYELRACADQGLIAELRLILDRRHHNARTVVQAPVLGMAIVRNPNGLCEQRPVIETTVQLGSVSKRVQLTLTNRSNMLFRVILGRKALKGDFVVDVSKKYMLRKKGP